MLTDKQKEILQHTLGADSRYKKREWGFRNHFVSGGMDLYKPILEELVTLGLMKCSGSALLHQGDLCYWATPEGMKAIGFTKKQILKTQER